MTPNRPNAFELCFHLLLVLALARATFAAVESQNPDAHIRLPLEAVPETLTEETEFSLFIWVHPAAGQPDQAAIFQVPGLLEVWLDAEDGVCASVQSDDLPPLVASTGAPYPTEEWALIAVSWQQFLGEVSVSVVSESTPLVSDSALTLDYVNATLGPAEAGPIVGAYLLGKDAMAGLTGLIALRDHDIETGDVEDVWETRRYIAPYDRKNNLAGGNMTGPDGCVWMLNHSMTTDPIELIDGSKPEHAAVVGGPVGLRNFVVYIKPSVGLGTWDILPYELFATDGFLYRSYRESAFDGFFVQDLPFYQADLSPVAGVAPLARQIADGPKQPIRVMVSANSRGVQDDDGSGESNGNYAGGVIDHHRANVAGVLFRPAVFTNSVNLGRPWFGFDIDIEDTVYTNFSAGIANVQFPGPLNAWHSFSRCFTASTGNNTLGPGTGLHLSPGTEYALRCRPEPGSLVVAEAPLVAEAYILRFPGSSAVSWGPSVAQDQASAGVSGPFQTVDLDTTVAQVTFGPGDSLMGTTLLLEDDITDLVSPGDACFVAGGPGFGSISEVVTAVPLDNGSRINLSHSFYINIGEGSELKFGPWGFDTLQHEFPPVDPGDPANWRGLRVDAEDDGLGGIIVCALSAWRPDVPGLLIGAAGTGGVGYTLQLEKAFPTAHKKWMSLSEADVWIVAPAQQQSAPESMYDYTQVIRDALPDAEVVWAGETVHAGNEVGNNQEPWHTYIVQNAAEAGVVGFTATLDERCGDYKAQLTDGFRKNGAHYSGRGARIIGEVWTDLLGEVALISTADCNNDAALNVFDFTCFQAKFNQQDASADLNGDGEFDIFDFIAFQQAFQGDL